MAKAEVTPTQAVACPPRGETCPPASSRRRARCAAPSVQEAPGDTAVQWATIPWEGESGREVTTPDPAATRDTGQEAGGAVGPTPACAQGLCWALRLLGAWARFMFFTSKHLGGRASQRLSTESHQTHRTRAGPPLRTRVCPHRRTWRVPRLPGDGRTKPFQAGPREQN